MLNNEPSFASLLVKQSPSMHYGHGWIMGKDGKRWHPQRNQSALLSELQSRVKFSFRARLKRFLEAL
ncbi:phage filamentation protein Fil family protein [Vagococcus sp. WN89Y]|uniref:phage filamentation protein Fil family protein n=1 Tax=Vagococcus sp. WN89Y TaxID=3457258 RepID=UPI003FCE0C73